MKKIKVNMTGPIILIVGIIALIAFRYNIRNQNEQIINDFKKMGVFTLGRVIEFNAKTYGPNGIGSSPSLKFSFNVQGVEYIEESDYNVPNDNGPKEGSLFMVIYLPNDPKRCALLLDYPVRDSSDYINYIEKFKKNPPKLEK